LMLAGSRRLGAVGRASRGRVGVEQCLRLLSTEDGAGGRRFEAKGVVTAKERWEKNFKPKGKKVVKVIKLKPGEKRPAQRRSLNKIYPKPFSRECVTVLGNGATVITPHGHPSAWPIFTPDVDQTVHEYWQSPKEMEARRLQREKEIKEGKSDDQRKAFLKRR